ncbi:NmrA family NAD(P)-binding protein [Streptomyces kronopolitis]|uniref:NmrA family NAD(P)-binding protein n=1 Tax=Streptomyces kronopolitis TaxID=1612435 RepID=UPI003416254F
MLAVAVTGVTGAQGGATAHALLAAGHHVRALTRRPNSPAADALRGLGVDVRHAHLDDHASLDAALSGADSLFAVTTPFGTDTATEAPQGKALVDAAAAARLGHIVLTSAAHADRGTAVPHYESKYLVEQYLHTADVPWTVIAPAVFMDNCESGGRCAGQFVGGVRVPLDDFGGMLSEQPRITDLDHGSDVRKREERLEERSDERRRIGLREVG